MSPMKSKSKSKDKALVRAGKEQQRASPKASGSTNPGSSSSSNAYNPLSRTFHALETSSIAYSALNHDNSHFQNIDETDEHTTNPQGTLTEYDSVSNNGSCSGESEDPKEKISNSSRQDIVPGSDKDRREKIRLKNEKKHQRQRERRAQELHDRCGGYLMSRKLEALAQQLVAMGISSERATLALMLNNGKLEESVSWLFEGSEKTNENDTTNLGSGGNLKIDITEELAQISTMEVRYNCSKQEVERVVVACEGDLQKAENTLKLRKQETSVTESKPEDSAQINNLLRSHESLSTSIFTEQRNNESDLHYLKLAEAVSVFSNSEVQSRQSVYLNYPTALPEKRWGGTTESGPFTPLTRARANQIPFLSDRREDWPTIPRSGEILIQKGAREPVVMMRHPQLSNTYENLITRRNAFPLGTTDQYVNRIPIAENIRSNGNRQASYDEFAFSFGPRESSIARVGGSGNTMGASSPSPSVPSEHQGSLSTFDTSSPSLTVPPSLGLFSGRSVAGTFSSSNVGWNTGDLMPEFDYTSVDWTLDYPASKSGGLWVGMSSWLGSSSGNRMAGLHMNRLHNVGLDRETSSSAGSLEWTSPFAGQDMFSVPRQFVTSPSLYGYRSSGLKVGKGWG